MFAVSSCGSEEATPENPAEPEVIPQIPDSGPRPRLVVPNPLVELGDLLKGESRSIDYPILNEGDSELRIIQLQPTCGCTVARIRLANGRIVVPLPNQPPNPGGLVTLAPGERCTVTIDFNSEDQPVGELAKDISVHSNDPLRRVTKLHIRTRLFQPFTIEPESIVFGEIRKGDHARQSLVIAENAITNARLLGFDSVPPYLSPSLETLSTDNNSLQYRISVEIRPDAPIGYQQDSIHIVLDHPTFKRLPIKVYATVLPRIRFDSGNMQSRERIDFEIIPIGGSRERSMEVSSLDPSIKFSVTGVDVISKHADEIHAQISTIEPGVRFRIDVTATPHEGTRFLRGILKVTTDHPDISVKEIPFQGWTDRS